MKKIILVSVLAASLAAGSAFAAPTWGRTGGETSTAGSDAVARSLEAAPALFTDANAASASPSLAFPAGMKIQNSDDLVNVFKQASSMKAKAKVKKLKSIAANVASVQLEIKKVSFVCSTRIDAGYTGITGPNGNTIGCSTLQENSEAAAAALASAQADMATCTEGGTSKQDCLKLGVKNNFCAS